MLVAVLCAGVSAAWGQSDYSTDYTGNITLSTTGGTSATACKVSIAEIAYDGIKAGTGSVAGAVKITVSQGTKYLHLHTAGWKGETVVLAVKMGNTDVTSINLTANDGITGNSPFTFSGGANSTDYYKVITFTNALSEDKELVFTATSGGKRFVIWGVTAEAEGGSGTTYSVTLGDDNTTLTESAPGAGVLLPTREPQGVFEFQGWSETNLTTETTTLPTIIPVGNYKPDNDITLYPIYKRSETVGGESTTASVNIAEYASANNWSNGTKYESLTIDENLTAAVAGGSNTGKYYTSNQSWRIYGSESGTLTITSTAGELKSVTFTYTNSTFKYGETTITSGIPVTVSGNSAKFTASGSAINITAISVTYGGGTTTNYYTSNPVETVVADPVITLAETYIGSTTATISCATQGATILYTFDVPTGTQTWTEYTDPVTITTSTTIYAKATKTGLRDSEVVNASTMRKAVTPTIEPNGGNFTEAQLVTLTSESGASIYYTTDGTEPTTSSTPYTAPFTISEDCTLKAKAFLGDYVSEVASASFAFVMIQDGVFDFNTTLPYVEGLAPSNDGTSYITEPKTWTAVNVTMVTAGKYRWWQSNKGNDLRFYNNDPASSMTFSVPNGKVITRISINGSNRNFVADNGTYTSNNGVWTGSSPTVTLSMTGTSTPNITKVIVTYHDAVKVSINQNASDADGKCYGTLYYSDKNLVVPTGLTAYTYKVTDGTLTESKEYSSGDVIPARTGVVVKTATTPTNDTEDYYFVVTTDEGDADADNMLHGTDGEATTNAGDGSWKYYALSLNSSNTAGTVGFYFRKGCSEGQAFTNGAHKAYLAVPVSQTGGAKGFAFNDATTTINGVAFGVETNNAAIYNLNGQRVDKNYKGVVIVNGKKMINK